LLGIVELTLCAHIIYLVWNLSFLKFWVRCARLPSCLYRTLQKR